MFFLYRQAASEPRLYFNGYVISSYLLVPHWAPNELRGFFSKEDALEEADKHPALQPIYVGEI